MPDVRCEMCDEPMHRYGWPTDADRHDPSLTACVNSLRATLDQALDLIQHKADEGQHDCAAFLRRRRQSGQGRRYPEKFRDDR